MLHKKMLLPSLLFVGVIAVSSAAEKVWNFDSIREVAPPHWAKTAAPGYVGDAENIACGDGNLTFTVTAPHSYFALNFMEADTEIVLDAKHYNLLKFRFYSPVVGRITLFYLSPDKEMASMDTAITVAEGWNEYEIPMREMTFGQEVHSPEGKGKHYTRWGGELEQVSGLRIDPWFPTGTTVKFDYIKLSDSTANGKDGK